MFRPRRYIPDLPDLDHKSVRISPPALQERCMTRPPLFDLQFLKDSPTSFRSMHWCPTSPFKRLRIISHVYHTQNCSGGVSFNPLYCPAERAVCILKRITTAHSSTLHISLRQSRPSPGFITPVPGRLPPVEFMAGLHPAVRSNTPPKGRRSSTFEDIPAQFPIEFCCWYYIMFFFMLFLCSFL